MAWVQQLKDKGIPENTAALLASTVLFAKMDGQLTPLLKDYHFKKLGGTPSPKEGWGASILRSLGAPFRLFVRVTVGRRKIREARETLERQAEGFNRLRSSYSPDNGTRTSSALPEPELLYTLTHALFKLQKLKAFYSGFGCKDADPTEIVDLQRLARRAIGDSLQEEKTLRDYQNGFDKLLDVFSEASQSGKSKNKATFLRGFVPTHWWGAHSHDGTLMKASREGLALANTFPLTYQTPTEIVSVLNGAEKINSAPAFYHMTSTAAMVAMLNSKKNLLDRGPQATKAEDNPTLWVSSYPDMPDMRYASPNVNDVQWDAEHETTADQQPIVINVSEQEALRKMKAEEPKTNDVPSNADAKAKDKDNAFTPECGIAFTDAITPCFKNSKGEKGQAGFLTSSSDGKKKTKVVTSLAQMPRLAGTPKNATNKTLSNKIAFLFFASQDGFNAAKKDCQVLAQAEKDGRVVIGAEKLEDIVGKVDQARGGILLPRGFTPAN
ncbi:MAG: hypothetical protein DHS20C10_04580 [marine bacterium B5-7]|nr:MAG: hypothetical protein DHS20C10_04580 [marine bacterium B5-7]